MIKTFTEIENALYEFESAFQTQDVMLSHSRMAMRSDGGAMFLNNSIDRTTEAQKRLNEYPKHWVAAVKHIMSLRNV